MALQHKIKWEIALSSRCCVVQQERKKRRNSRISFNVVQKQQKPLKSESLIWWKQRAEKQHFFSSSICSIISHGPFTAKFSQADSSFLSSLLFKVLLRISKWDLSDKSMCGCLHRGFLICFDSSRSKKSLFTCLFRGIFMLDFGN